MERRFDKIDFVILNEIVKDPRVTLVRLNAALEKHSYKLSLESIRKRLEIIVHSNIKFLPLLDWKEFEMELYEIRIKISGGNESKNLVKEKLKLMGAFLFYDTFGEVDITASFLVKKNNQISDIMDSLKELKEIRSLNYSVITHHELFDKNMARFINDF
ncbi:MAG TPA: hypothetical protein VI894_03160 [Candidatus Nanoarchaeia archaeon]|nr:hypothetical protein [Candidatus Nanoarchaeia archaeon]